MGAEAISGDPEEESGAQETQLPPLIAVPVEAAGMRLDTWLSRLPGAPSRNRIQQLVKDGHVRLNGELAKRSHEIAGGETVTIEWPPLDDDWPFPEDIPIDVVYEDDEVIVINKQANLIVHPSAGNPDGTLVNALVFHYPNLPGINGVRRPGIVHRLDRDTTGLIVVAKTERAMTSLAKQLAARTMHRNYIAIVIGDVDWETITVDAAIGRDPVNRLKRAIDGGFPKSARSHFSVLKRSGQYTLIGCKLETGRTHQIRIHCKHIGHPILCDEIYGGHLQRSVEKLINVQHELKRAIVHFNRPFLHARELEFNHPSLHKSARFQVPPPEDSQSLMRMIFGNDISEIIGQRKAEIVES
ncbi:RluA family pseudouridine synthase [soil metagenome]